MRRFGNSLVPVGREIPREPIEGEMITSDPLREFEVAMPELERLVKCSLGRRMYIWAGWFARSINQEGAPAGTTRGLEIKGNVEVSKKVALKFLATAYPKQVRTMVYARIVFNNHCLFIGG